jgi:hypothetical protein
MKRQLTYGLIRNPPMPTIKAWLFLNQFHLAMNRKLKVDQLLLLQ